MFIKLPAQSQVGGRSLCVTSDFPSWSGSIGVLNELCEFSMNIGTHDSPLEILKVLTEWTLF